MDQVKIVVFVPKTHADIVRQAMGDAGAGKGRFLPLEGAHPAIGSVGKMEEVEEERIECECGRSKAKEVISAMRKVHPYEEVAFDIYPLISEEEL